MNPLYDCGEATKADSVAEWWHCMAFGTGATATVFDVRTEEEGVKNLRTGRGYPKPLNFVNVIYGIPLDASWITQSHTLCLRNGLEGLRVPASGRATLSDPF